MEFFIFFILFFSIFLHTDAVDTNCAAVKCSSDSPDILSPFSLHGLQPQNCSYPGFKLVCRETQTIIHFPSYGDLVVKSISYDIKKLNLLDPRNCVHEVFLNLNLSRTPFQYYYVVRNYTYFNCSSPLSPSFEQVPCLSGPGRHVYVLEAWKALPDSCRPVKTVTIPFSYSSYLADNSFGLGFTWDLPGGEDFEVQGGNNESWFRCFDVVHVKVISILIFIFMGAMLMGVKVYCSKKDWEGKLLRKYETLRLSKKTRGLGDGDYGSESKGILQSHAYICMLEEERPHEKASIK